MSTGRGDGGVHIFYRVPQGATLGCGTLGAGVDIIVPGKYGVIPPSIHPDTGRAYCWGKLCSPLECALADAPPHIIALLQRRDAPPVDDEPEDVCLEEIIDALVRIDAEPYFIWMRVGFILKRVLGDDLGWRLFEHVEQARLQLQRAQEQEAVG